MIDMNRTMQDAMRLMKAGDVAAATRAIRSGLGAAVDTGSEGTQAPQVHGRADCLEGTFRVVPDSDSDIVADRGGDARDDATKNPEATDPASQRDGHSRESGFHADRFTSDAGALGYKLFVPTGLDSAPPPLLVMLHGCTQTPDDFAQGTRMNALAQDHGYVVAYPAQAQSSSAGRCWNWFRSRDQQRGQGEPALIAALTRHLVATHGLDARRVYVAGLSAGGAMAMVLANTYPEMFAAVGVHSGLPFGAAHDLPSALAAMRQGIRARPVAASPARGNAVPAIVFHGDRDTTVDPCNGAAVVAQCVGDNARDDTLAAARTHVDRGSTAGGRAYTLTTFENADGSIAAEHWLVHGAGHAWFGGDAAGSYADPAGPDASHHMLRFFSAVGRGAAPTVTPDASASA